VLRGGFLSAISREKNLRRVHKAYGLWGICVAAEPSRSPDEIAAKGTFGNEYMLIALSDELSGCPGVSVVVEPGRDWPHALLKFDHEPTEDDWCAVVEVFQQREPSQNPSYKGR
jgi:hypothetical protein